MTRRQLTLLAALLAAPMAGLAILLTSPSTDVHWQHEPSHFWLVLADRRPQRGARVHDTGSAARRRGDRRVHLVSLAFLAASGFLALHALATPGVLLDRPNLGFVIATPIGLVIAAAFAAESALDRDRVRPMLLQHLLFAAFGVWLVVSLTLLPEIDDSAVPGRMSWPLVVLSVAGVVLYVFAVVRYLALWRERGSDLILALAVASSSSPSRWWRSRWAATGKRPGGSGTC